MATAQPRLSSRLHARLTSLLTRLLWLRLVRGLALTGIVLALVAGVAFGVDYFVGLSAGVRVIVLRCWAGLGVGLVLGSLLSLLRLPATTDLAALIEERYPEL